MCSQEAPPKNMVGQGFKTCSHGSGNYYWHVICKYVIRRLSVKYYSHWLGVTTAGSHCTFEPGMHAHLAGDVLACSRSACKIYLSLGRPEMLLASLKASSAWRARLLVQEIITSKNSGRFTQEHVTRV